MRNEKEAISNISLESQAEQLKKLVLKKIPLSHLIKYVIYQLKWEDIKKIRYI